MIFEIIKNYQVLCIGFYYCYGGNVTKIYHAKEENAYYHIDYIINYATQVAQMFVKNTAEVDLMIYSCIG